MTESLIGQQLENYKIEGLLGRGGMSQVYLGRDVNLNRQVAIKVVDSRHRGNPAYAERFIREAQSIAALNHEHIIKIFHFSTSDTLSFFAMEYIEGRNLGSILTTYKYRELLMPNQEILHVIYQLAKALDYAHEQGVVHRDIKPSNVMIEDHSQRIVLMDFGLVLEMGRGTLGKVFGSAQYIAPEQAVNSANAIPKSDLYALGVIIFEILTGELPFSAPSAAVVAMKHVNELPPSARKFNPNLPPEIDTFFDRVLAKDPAERFESAMILYEHLVRILEIASSPQNDEARLTLPSRNNPLGYTPTQDEFAPPKAAASIPNPSASIPLYDQETYRGGVPEPPHSNSEETYHTAPHNPSYAHFEPQKSNHFGIIGIGIGLIIVAAIILAVVGILIFGDENGDNENENNQANIQTPATATPFIVGIDEGNGTPDNISGDESTLAIIPSETPSQSQEEVSGIVSTTETPNTATAIQIPTQTLTFTFVPPTTLPATHTASPTDTNTPTPIPSDTSTPTSTFTPAPTIATATHTATVQSATPSPASPTILYPNGHQLRLFYDDYSFYLWNPSEPQLAVRPFTFEGLDSSGLPTERLFEGLAWTQFYGFVEPRACVTIEITRSPTWLRPTRCRYNNSLLLPPRTSDMVFWIQHGEAVEFRVLWNGEEIGRCPLADGEQQCDIFIP